ncbi:cytokinin hydroxylase [Gossypium raimondii]|uniref:Cytochrome P450 n=1 Tax=Gossypium raimondii TaxID=29730 RepID=A0A0D2NVG8_GOSRA|nr:cytokinin hydroxylase [Gossypium raimondii]KJB37292.1 hypothetical protein B456_006G198200 [Gossypium raimondii]MBA0588283.1 hypothetical protein [Gossypium raimondii]
MGILKLSQAFMSMAMVAFLVYLLLRLLFSCWILPIRAYRKIKKNGFEGPTPSFPLGNITDMKNTKNYVNDSSLRSSAAISHDLHSTVFPYFARWQKTHGKVFIYWLGTEPFLYIAEPEFLKKMSSGVLGKNWGKPSVFRRDRKAMFGRSGLVMVEGEDWVRHRHVITPAFSPANLKAMASLMVEPATNMLNRWTTLISCGKAEIDVEREITTTAGEIIARTSFGLSHQNGNKVFEKLRAAQTTLFNSNRYVGVPFSKWICPKKNLEATKLGHEIDQLLLSIIHARKQSWDGSPQKDLLGLLMEGSHLDGRSGKSLTARELVDECKTFFFGGHETTALALTWTLLLLSLHPQWQHQLREEIKQVIGDEEIDFTRFAHLKKMEWVMKEVLRLYSPAPNAQRQAREDIKVDELVIPNGTNIWIDVVALHHDPTIWGGDVNEFRPERFKDDSLYGGCKHKMGFLPFGFGGRMCVGRNLTMMEYKVVLTLMLRRFSFSISPNYRHSPSIMLSLRPKFGLPLIVKPL